MFVPNISIPRTQLHAGFLLGGQANTLEKALETGVRTQRIHAGVHFEVCQAFLMNLVRFLQPVESVIFCR
jgi:hypothetical protein